MTSFRADVRDGNSGGPVVDSKGRVLATVFAAAIGEKPRSGLGIPDPIVQRAISRADEPVDTGPCVT
jgi:S1-C subfamily serine protease